MNWGPEVQDADSLRVHLGFEKVAVLGHSFGGFIALEYAMRYPERLSHLILPETTPTFDYGEEVEANARRKGATAGQLEALEASADNNAEFWQLWKLIESLYFHTFDADIAGRVLSACWAGRQSASRRMRRVELLRRGGIALLT
jgi:proline iminopeptidase